MENNFKLIIKGMESGRIEELYEMMDFVVSNNTYLKGKLKDKEIGSELNKKDFEDNIKKVDSKVVKDMLREKIKDLDKLRGEELMKRYGKLFFKDSVYNKVMGIKKKDK